MHNLSSARAFSGSLVLHDLNEESGGDRQEIRGRNADLVLRQVPGNRRQNPGHRQRRRAPNIFAARLELLRILDGILSRSRGVGPPLKTTPQEVLRILRAPRRLGPLAALPLARLLAARSLARAHARVWMKPPAADPTRTPLDHRPWLTPHGQIGVLRPRPPKLLGPLLVSRPGSFLDSAWVQPAY